MTVELIYDQDCPNVSAARANLMKAFAASGEEARWTEWERSAADSPPHVRDYGSPTVLVDGKAAAGDDASADGASCRVYRNGTGGFTGVPPVERIAAALAARNGGTAVTDDKAGGKSSLVAMAGVVFAFLPKFACPVCWPAYAGLLGSLGLGFLLDESYLFPLTAAFLALAAGALAYRARLRRGYGPFVVGLAASTLVLTGKFVFSSDAAMYGGIAVLIAVSVWNAWPVRGKSATCTACLPGSSPDVYSTHQKETSS
jgi:mercuric ion transport protein